MWNFPKIMCFDALNNVNFTEHTGKDGDLFLGYRRIKRSDT